LPVWRLSRGFRNVTRLAEIESQLGQVTAAFTQLDTLKSEEPELANACEQVATEFLKTKTQPKLKASNA
jgi:hypothetical protein